MKLKKTKIYTSKDLFDAVMEAVKNTMGKRMDILDYCLPASNTIEIKDIEFDIIAETKWGGSEGIYTDICIEGNTGNADHTNIYVGTMKTLYESDDYFREMALFGAEFQILGRKWIDAHENELVRSGYGVGRIKDDDYHGTWICHTPENAVKRYEEMNEQEDTRKVIVDLYTLKEINPKTLL